MVKRLRFITLIFLIILSGSCERESLTNAIESPFKGKDIDRIVKAQEWLLKNSPITKSEEQWNPLWEDAFTDDFSSIQTVEIPLELKKFSIPIHPDCKAKYNETKDPKYLNTITRLIIKTDSKTGKTDGFFMSIVPSLKYLEETNFKPLNNSYLSKDEKYDGYIIFRDLSGNYVNGWQYEDGKIKKSLKPATNELPLTKAVYVTTWCQPVYSFYSLFWLLNGNIFSYIGDIIIETTQCWVTYEYEDPIDGDPGGSYTPQESTYTITINKIGNGVVSGEGTYPIGITVNVSAVPAQNSIFAGWSGSVTSSDNIISVTMNSNINLTAKFVSINDYFSFNGFTNSQDFINAILPILSDCAGSVLASNLQSMYGQIVFNFNSSAQYLSSFLSVGHTISINMNFFDAATRLMVFHELFHAFQHGMGYFADNEKNINLEVEAFLAMYKYAVKNNLTAYLPVYGSNSWYDSMNPYIQNQNDTTYNDMVIFVRSLSDRYNETAFPDNLMKRTTNNIGLIFNCY